MLGFGYCSKKTWAIMFVPDRPTGITVQFHCSCNMRKRVFKISWHFPGYLKFACECFEYVYEESNRFSFQVANKYCITVEAKDRGVVKLSSTATIIVNLQDGNNNLPVITGQTVSVKGIFHPPPKKKCIQKVVCHHLFCMPSFTSCCWKSSWLCFFCWSTDFLKNDFNQSCLTSINIFFSM